MIQHATPRHAVSIPNVAPRDLTQPSIGCCMANEWSATTRKTESGSFVLHNPDYCERLRSQ